MPPLSYLSFHLSRSLLPIARRDDTLPAGDKGFELAVALSWKC